MPESREIIEMNIDRYRKLLIGPLDNQTRASVEQLLADAVSRLALAATPRIS